MFEGYLDQAFVCHGPWELYTYPWSDLVSLASVGVSIVGYQTTNRLRPKYVRLIIEPHH